MRQIVGVMPRGFRLVDSDFDLILPAAFDQVRSGVRIWLRVMQLRATRGRASASLRPN